MKDYYFLGLARMQLDRLPTDSHIHNYAMYTPQFNRLVKVQSLDYWLGRYTSPNGVTGGIITRLHEPDAVILKLSLNCRCIKISKEIATYIATHPYAIRIDKNI